MWGLTSATQSVGLIWPLQCRRPVSVATGSSLQGQCGVNQLRCSSCSSHFSHYWHQHALTMKTHDSSLTFISVFLPSTIWLHFHDLRSLEQEPSHSFLCLCTILIFWTTGWLTWDLLLQGRRPQAYLHLRPTSWVLKAAPSLLQSNTDWVYCSNKSTLFNDNYHQCLHANR